MIQEYLSQSNSFNIYLSEASRKYVFNSYRLFSELQSDLSDPEIPLEKLKFTSENFRLALNDFIQDLLFIEENIYNEESILPNKIDIIIEFTRLSHLIEIMLLNNPNERYFYIIKWLQVIKIIVLIYIFIY